MGKNIFVNILELIKVRHTKSFSNKLYGEHPHKYNIFGLSQMLSEYGIKNICIRIEDKKKIELLETPFVAHLGGDFVIVSKITTNRIYFNWRNKNIHISLDEFINSWTGVALIISPNENSIEPNYFNNRNVELFNKAQGYLLAIIIGIILILFYLRNQINTNFGESLVLLINLIGVSVGYLLIQKQSNVQSNYADKLCSLFHESDCNNILESKAAKLWGIIGWSEIGFSYFISNFIIILIIPKLITYLALINLCVLPYSFWSIWYQKVKAKRWCPLCLIVQVLLWAYFFIHLTFGYLHFKSLNIDDLALVCCIYCISFILTNILVLKFTMSYRVTQITQEVNSIKAIEDVFYTLLKKQPYYNIDKSNSSILFGNPNSTILITVFTNPHCEPCGKMHERIEKFLINTNEKFCIQYIFSSFNKSLDASNKFLIGSYFNNDIGKVRNIYNDWYINGKTRKDELVQKFNYEDNRISKEFSAHEDWKEKNGLRETPTILVNGYKLPENYKIEDLKFIELEIDVR